MNLKRTFWVQRSHRIGFFTEQSIGSGHAFYLRLGQIPPRSVTTPVQLQIWFGSNEAPQNADGFELYLRVIDVNTIPDRTSMRVYSEWMGAQRWYGTISDVKQTLSHENLIIISGETSNMELATRTREFHWSFTISATASITTIALGTFAYTINMETRVWSDDAYTWNGDPDVINNDGISEIDMDVDQA